MRGPRAASRMAAVLSPAATPGGPDTMSRARICVIALVAIALALTVPAAAGASEPGAASAGAREGAAGDVRGKGPEVRPVDPPADVLDALRGADRKGPAPKEEPPVIPAEG